MSGYRRLYHVDGLGIGRVRAHWGLASEGAPPPTTITLSRERAWAGHPSLPSESVHAPLYRLASALVAGDVLDAGCGSGYGAGILTDAGCRVTGLDVDPTACEFARNFSGCPVVCGSLEALPFETASFDAVVAVESVEHVQDDRAMFAEIARVLRPCGHIVITTPMRGAHGMSPFHVREYLPEEITALLAAVGMLVQIDQIPDWPGTMFVQATR